MDERRLGSVVVHIPPMSDRQNQNSRRYIGYMGYNPIISYAITPLPAAVRGETFAFLPWIFNPVNIFADPGEYKSGRAFIELF